METADTLQTARQSQKYFPPQAVLVIVHELLRSASLFSSDSHRAKAAGPQRPTFADASGTAGDSVQDSKQNSQTAEDMAEGGTHRVNTSRTRSLDRPCQAQK